MIVVGSSFVHGACHGYVLKSVQSDGVNVQPNLNSYVLIMIHHVEERMGTLRVGSLMEITVAFE